MEIKRKLRLLTWIFIIFAAFTISTFIFMFSKPFIRDPKGIFLPQPMHQPNNPGQFADYLIDNIKLSEQQKNQLIDLQKGFRQNAKEILDSIHYFNEEIDELLEKNNFDSCKIDLYATMLSKCNYKLKYNFFLYYKDIYNLLDTNQQKELFVVYQQFRQCCKVPHNPNVHKNKNNNPNKNQRNPK